MALVKGRRSLARTAPAFPGFGQLPTFEDMDTRMRKMIEGNILAPSDFGLFAESLGFLPATDITETKDQVTITVELPGLEKKDLDIDVDGDLLTVRGEKTEEKTEDDKKYHCVERTYGSFQRSFMLPRTVDSARISAEFEKGVLKVMLPKTAEAKAKGRKVDIAVK